MSATTDTELPDRLLARYDAYVGEFRDAGGALPKLMRLKRTHTAMVVRNAREIADGERFDAATRDLALAAALLHDTGRYEQLKRYDTFVDAKSVDHAVLSHSIVIEQGWLDGCAEREAILAAVLYHNRRELPPDLDPLTATLAHTVRDADKLDIFRVLEEEVSKSDWRSDTRAFWNLTIDAPPSPAVVDAIFAGRPVDYADIRTLADFVLNQVGWIASGLHFATSSRLAVSRNHLEFRRQFLYTITDSPSIDRICTFVLEKCGMLSGAES